MVVFHTDHWGAMAAYTILAVTKHKEEQKVLIFPTNDENKICIMERLKKAGFFSKVVYNYPLTFPGKESDNKEIIREKILQFFDDVMKKNELYFSKDDMIYTVTDIHGVFRYYLQQKQIPYCYFSFTVNQIYDKWNEYAAFKIGQISERYMELLREANVYNGRHELCKKVIVLPETIIDDRIQDIRTKVEVFNLKNTIEELKIESNQVALSIIHAYDENNLEQLNYDCLLASNSVGYVQPILYNLGIKGDTKKIQMLMYQHAMDVFYDQAEFLLIKPHPNNDINWAECFDNCRCLSKDVPMELFRLIPNFKIHTAISLETNSMVNINDLIDNNIQLTRFFMYVFLYFCSIYVSCKMLEYLSISKRIYFDGTGEKLTNILFNKFTSGGWCILPIRKELNSMGDNAFLFSPGAALIRYSRLKEIVVIIELPNNLPENKLLHDFFQNCYLVRVHKQALSSKCYEVLQDEYVFVYDKSGQLESKIRSNIVEKNFPYSSLKISSECMNDAEKELWIKNYYQKQKIFWLQKKIDFLEKVKSGEKNICQITDFSEYLLTIKYVKSDYLCLMAVKDNAGCGWNYNDCEAVKDIGIKTRLDSLYWNSFLCIWNNKKILIEKSGEFEEDSYLKTNEFGFEIELFSGTYNKSNKAVIKIDGINYALNRRGINIIVFDKKNGQVLDKVVFDFFDDKHNCHREENF